MLIYLSRGGGKLGHIVSVVCDIKSRSGLVIRKDECLFLDDDLRNVDKARAAGLCYSAWFPATYEDKSARAIVFSELEGLFLRNEPWKILATSSEVPDAEERVPALRSRLCTIL